MPDGRTAEEGDVPARVDPVAFERLQRERLHVFEEGQADVWTEPS